MMRRAVLLLILIGAVFTPVATSLGYHGGDHSDKRLERCYPYEQCTSCGEKYYADGYCDKCEQRCSSYETCPKCNMNYLCTTYADGKCDRCGGNANIIERCDECGYNRTFDGKCDKCDQKCNYNHCCEDCYVKCYPFEFCLTCGAKYYADGYCEKCGEKGDMVKFCPRCNMNFKPGTTGDMGCPMCGGQCIFIERCSKCGHVHTYDGHCDTCKSKSFYDKCCYIYCDRFCYEYSNKCKNAPCPDCQGIKREEVYGSSFNADELGYAKAQPVQAPTIAVPAPAPEKPNKGCLTCDP